MIPRYQRVLFLLFSALILLMAGFTIHERQKSRDRFVARYNSGPYIEPADTPSESITLDLAIDADGSILSAERSAALPEEPTQRARALLERLFSEYALPESPHPLPSGPAVNDVFLLRPPAASAKERAPSGQLAVVNLRGTFVNAHPSGAEVEALTIQSIIGTLHANLPDITQVRFLVDGQPRDTLAGHADLRRTYDAVDTTTSPITPTTDFDSSSENQEP